MEKEKSKKKEKVLKKTRQKEPMKLKNFLRLCQMEMNIETVANERNKNWFVDKGKINGKK